MAVGAASNALGTVTDVAALARAAHEHGAFVFVDAVHYAPHERVDVAALGCDALGCSPYKFYGPHLGCLYVAREHLEKLDIPRLPCAGNEGGERLETGTLSHEAMVGAAAAVEWLAGLAQGPGDDDRRARLDAAYGVVHARADALLARLWNGLDAFDGVTLYGPPPGTPRTSTLAFTVAGVPAESVTRRLSDQCGVFTSHGDFYASTVVEDLGLAPHGLVRAGVAIYTPEDEVDRLLEGVQRIIAEG